MLEKILSSPELICQIAREAGEVILEFYKNKNFTITLKPDNSPVTQADWEAHVLIDAALRKHFPFPVVSEETYKTTDIVSSTSPYWLLDPLDGTKEFINRSGDFTVNIALIRNHFPILGVIYAPLRDELYYSAEGKGAFCKRKGTDAQIIKTRPLRRQEFIYLVTRRQDSVGTSEIHKHWPNAIITRMGSSLKFCKIADGSADIYIRRGPTHEWDTGAAQIIVEEAGGKILNFLGERLTYNKPSMRNDSFIAFGDESINYKEFVS